MPHGGQSAEEAVCAILSRWDASKNTFKHIQERHPLHYHPGFALVESERQEIANPQIKDTGKLITRLRKAIAKLHRKLFKAKDQTNKDGTPRSNSQRQRLQNEIPQQEAELERAREEKKRLPERIDVSTLENYRSFKRIDNEGKYLFDFVTLQYGTPANRSSTGCVIITSQRTILSTCSMPSPRAMAGCAALQRKSPFGWNRCSKPSGVPLRNSFVASSQHSVLKRPPENALSLRSESRR